MLTRHPLWAQLLRALLIVSVSILLITIPLRVFVSSAFVRLQYALPGFPPSVRFDARERERISDPLVRYLRGQGSLAEMATVATDDGDIALREDELQHMIDVRVVMDGFWLAHKLALLATALSLAGLWLGHSRGKIVGALRQSVWLMASIMALIIIAATVDFNLFFTRFHQVFFSEGSWLFYEEDTLIQLYPITFWVRAILAIAVTILAEAALLFVAANALSRQLKAKENAA